MRILLVNSNRETTPWPVIPIGLCLVATATEGAGHDVTFVDLTLCRNPARRLREAIVRQRPEVVGVSVRNIDNCNFEAPRFYLEEIRQQVVGIIRQAAPHALLVVGGSAVNVAPRQVATYLEADVALAGEGEVAMPDLLSYLEGRTDNVPSGMHCIVDLGAWTKRRTTDGAARPDGGFPSAQFDRAPRFLAESQAYRWTKWSAYALHASSYPIQTKRGCALRCSYCVYNSLEGSAYRLRTPSEVATEIEHAMERGIERFEFVDSTFNVPKRHALAICEELARRKLGARFSTMGLNPCNVDDRLVDAMLEAGFDNVMCSAESASNAILQSLAKGYSQAHVERTARALVRGNLPTYWFFLLGAPGENAETVEETLDFCAQYIPASHVVLFATGLRILPGTPLEHQCRESGWLCQDDDLLAPTWYVSPELDLKELGRAFERRSQDHPNWMLNGEAALSPRLAFAMRSGFRMLGWTGPFWQHLPRVFGLAARVGSRQRGVHSAWNRVLQVRDVVHHR